MSYVGYRMPLGQAWDEGKDVGRPLTPLSAPAQVTFGHQRENPIFYTKDPLPPQSKASMPKWRALMILPRIPARMAHMTANFPDRKLLLEAASVGLAKGPGGSLAECQPAPFITFPLRDLLLF